MLKSRSVTGALAAVASGAVIAASLIGAQAPAGAAESGGSRDLLRSGGVAAVETAGPIATVRASGEPAPLLGPSVAVMPDGGVVGGRSPFLAVPALAPEPGRPSVTVPVRVLDVSSGRDLAVWSGTVTDGWGRIAATLVAGRGYRVDASPKSGEWQQIGWFVVRGPEAVGGPSVNVSGLNVSEVTGGVSWGWASRALAGPVDGVGLSLGWSAGSSTPAGLDSVLPGGVPAGWRLGAASGSEWAGIVESGSSFAQIVSWSGTVLVFERNASGVWMQRTGSGVAGFANDLQRASDGSWTFTDTQGVSTTFVDGHAVAVNAAGRPVSTVKWDSRGRIDSIANGVGQSMDLIYADAGVSCPSASWTAFGFVAPPAEMLCRVSYPGGIATDLGYVGGAGSISNGVQIGMIKDPGNQGVALGWDSLGRLVSERDAMATRVATVDAATKAVVSRVDYDSRGRASELFSAPAVAGGQALRKTITFPAATEAVLKTWALNPQQGNDVRAQITYAVGGGDRVSETTWFNPVTWAPVKGTDIAGRGVTMKVNPVSGRMQSQTDSVGRVTSYEYNSLGLVVKTTGPVMPGRGTGTAVATKFDTDRVQGKDKALAGMRGRVTTAEGTNDEFWKSDGQRGGFSYVWAGRSGVWNGQATGIWDPANDVDKAAAAAGWSFSVAASGARVQVFIGSRACSPGAAGTCTIASLPVGPKQITVVVTNAGTRGWFEVKAAPVGSALAPIPAAEVSPGYALASVLTTNDTFSGRSQAPETVYDYTDPSSGHPAAIIAPGGLRTSYTYADAWDRMTKSVTPGGEFSTTSYWPDSAAVTAPAACGGTTLQVLGQIKSITRQDGSVVTTYWDVRGRLVAQVNAGGAGRQTVCSTYFDDDSVKSTAVYDSSDVLIERTDVARAIGGDPRQSRTTITHGPAAPVRPGDVAVTTVWTDLNSQVVKSVESFGRESNANDVIGATTVTAYSVLGLPLTVTATAPHARTQVTAYTYDRETLQLSSVVVNGVVAARMSYNAATGALTSIEYPNGIAASYGYSATGLLSSVDVAGAGATFTDRLDRTSFGRITGASLTVTGPDAFVENRSYDYDPETGRLAEATIASTQSGVDPRTVYGYRYAAKQDASCGDSYAGAGRDGLRTGGSRNGVAYVTCHDAKGRVVSTTDPILLGGARNLTSARIEHDGLGRVTAITGIARPLDLTWSAGGQLAIVREGDASSTVVTSSSTFNGGLVRRTVNTISGTSRLLFSGPFAFNLDAAGAVTGVASTQFTLPGGAQVTTTYTSANANETRMIVAGVDGSAIAEFRVRGLSTGGPTTAAAADRFGPFGEPLATPSVTDGTALRQFGWRAGSSQETLAGSSSITLLGARGYLPALGEFLSTDPVVDGGTNLYSYTSGDPINARDPSGGSESWDTWDIVLAASAGALALASGSAFAASLMRTSGKAASNIVGAVTGILGAGAATGLALKAKADGNDTAMWVGIGIGIASAAFGAANIVNGLRPAGTWRAPKAKKMTIDEQVAFINAQKAKQYGDAPTGWAAPTVKQPDWVMAVEQGQFGSLTRDAGFLGKLHEAGNKLAPDGQGWLYSVRRGVMEPVSQDSVQFLRETGSRIERYNNVLVELA